MMRSFVDVQYDIHEACKLDLFLPDMENFPIIVFFHGGGMVSGSKQAHTEMGKRFAELGYGFASVDYRLYPNAKYPDFVVDGANAVAFVKRRAKEYGGNGELFIGGNSAGAWLAIMLCLNGEFLSAVGVDRMQIKGWAIDSAQMTAHFNVLNKEMGLDTRLQRVNEFAPLYYVDENLKFTRMLTFCYDDDLPTRPEQNALFYKAVLYFNPQADITALKLPGGHCQGTTFVDDDSEYPFVKEFIKWVK